MDGGDTFSSFLYYIRSVRLVPKCRMSAAIWVAVHCQQSWLLLALRLEILTMLMKPLSIVRLLRLYDMNKSNDHVPAIGQPSGTLPKVGRTMTLGHHSEHVLSAYSMQNGSSTDHSYVMARQPHQRLSHQQVTSLWTRRNESAVLFVRASRHQR